ncbi:hypothetical protein WG29040_23095 [Pseudomonas sp. PAMC 29040]|uniref:BapA/Bap/LapF family large adhesin n=1 Tax=Pseudomonas sp. PAMC 29040 TaxID=2498450 RepID=UPI000F9BFFF5|nr:BapA/Bap/LapF family large adhesin [Pseudomonas sp. PAMC 29040]RUT31539.1 hypothetical protein WG29040_23095 [Pseudomonas sp. PAMC 29040]
MSVLRLADILGIPVGTPPAVQTFTVANDTEGTLNLTFKQADVLSLLNGGVTVRLEVSDGAGGWKPVQEGSNGAGLLDLLGLLGSSTTAKVEGLAAGQYRLTMDINPSLLAVLSGASAVVSVTNESQVDFTATGGVVEGNVITDNGVSGIPDSTGTGADATVNTVNGEAVNADPAVGTVVTGLYGALTIFADGSYTYTSNGNPADIGKLDAFVYQLTTPAGGTATATLYVRTDSTDSTVVWDPANPTAPGTGELLATDDIDTAQVDLVLQVINSPSTATNYTGPGIGGTVTEHFGQTVTVEAGMTAELFVNRTGSSATTTIVLQKFNGTTWVNEPGQSTTDATHTFTLGAGDYRLSSSTAKVLVGTAVSVVQTLATHTGVEITGPTIAVTGNVLAAGDHSVADSQGSSLTVLSVLVDGAYVVPGQIGTVVQGDFGTLTIQGNGDYSYKPTEGGASTNIGQVDSFSYQLTTPSGQMDTATLYIRIDSPGSGLVWDDANPGNPGTDSPGFAAASVVDDSSQAKLTEVADGTDPIATHDTGFVAVHEADGSDTQVWEGGDASINLHLLIGNASNVESIDLNDFSAVDLTVSLEDLVALTSTGTDRLFIQGDDEDSVQLTGNWTVGSTQLENGQEYVVYTSQEDETHQLWVQSGINVV